MKDQMLAAIRCVEYLKRFEIREYGKAYKEYVQTYRDVFVEAIHPAEESDGDELLNAIVEDLLNALEAGWKAERFWNRAAARTNQKQMIIFYLSPMLLGLEEEPASARFAELLRDGWAARWPKDAYEIADYKTIRKGFHNVILGVDLDSLRRSYDDEE